MNNFYFKILSNFWGSLHTVRLPLFLIYNDLQNKIIRFVRQHPAGDPKLAGPWAPGSAAAAQAFKIRRPVRRPVKGACGCTAAKAPQSTVSMQPAPVTRRIRSLPPETVCRAVPSVTRSSAPESTTTVPSFCASAWAQAAASMGTVRLSTPCSAAERPNRAAASP